MSQHPTGVFNPLRPFAPGPVAPLYFNELASPKRAIRFLAEIDVDAIDETTNRIQPLVAGVFNSMARIDQTVIQTIRSQIRYATHPLITAAGDQPANTPIEPRLAPINLERKLASEGDGMFAPVADSAVSVVDLQNRDGALDYLDDGAAIIGRDIRISVAASSASALSDFGPIYRGVVDGIGWTRDNLQLTVRDFREKLQQLIQQHRYTGSGDIDGSPELKDVTKPIAFGRCRNVRPTLIDPARLIYQFHDGEARAVDVVRDMGVALERHGRVDTFSELFGLTPPSVDDEGDFPLGSYVHCPPAGCFRLAGQPAGVVTADVKGAGGTDSLSEPFSDGTRFTDGTGWRSAAVRIYSRTAGKVIARLLIDHAGLTDADVNLDHIAQLDAHQPYEVGLYLPAGGQMTVIDAVTQLCRSWGYVLIRSKDGRYQLRDLRQPNETPVVRISADMVDEGEIERAPLPYRQPWAAVDVAYGRNWSPLGESELAGAVPAADRTALTRDVLTTQARDTTIGILYPDRAVARIETLLTRQEDADELGARFFRIYPHARSMFNASVRGIPYQLELMDTVELTHPRFGLTVGRRFTVVGISENGLSRATELELFGGAPNVFIEEVHPGVITAVGIVSGEVLGVPVLPANITAIGIATAQAFGAPVVASLTVVPIGIASAQAFGTPALAARIAAVGITTAEMFGSPAVAIVTDRLLLEDGQELLLETGEPLLLESAEDTTTTIWGGLSVTWDGETVTWSS